QVLVGGERDWGLVHRAGRRWIRCNDGPFGAVMASPQGPIRCARARVGTRPPHRGRPPHPGGVRRARAWPDAHRLAPAAVLWSVAMLSSFPVAPLSPPPAVALTATVYPPPGDATLV